MPPYADMTLVQRFKDRQTQLEDDRQPLESTFEGIVKVFQPGFLWSESDAATTGGGDVYDGTPSWALRVMSNGWLGNLMAESLRWMQYENGVDDLDGNDDLNKWMQDLEKHMYGVFRESRLYEHMTPYTRVAFSTGSPILLPGRDRNGKIAFEMPHPRENYHGSHGIYHRKFKMRALDAWLAFGKGNIPDDDDAGPLSAGLIRSLREGRHHDKYEFLRCYCRKDDPILQGQPPRYRRAPWMEFTMELGARGPKYEARPLQTQPYYTKPHIKWDYEVDTDRLWARTPAWHSLSDTYSLQELARQQLAAGEWQMNPPLWALAKYRSQYRKLQPGGRVYYEQAGDVNNAPQPIQGTGNYPWGIDVRDSLSKNVERWFQVPLFLSLWQLAQSKEGWPTATHVVRMDAQTAAMLTPIVGAFNGVVNEIEEAIFDLEYRAGNLPDEPDALVQYREEQAALGKMEPIRFPVRLVGPLAALQRKALTIDATQTGLMILGNYAAFDPLVVDKVRASVALERDLEMVSFPQEAIVPEDEYQELRAAKIQAQAQAQQAEQAGNLAAAVPKLSGKIETGSPLARILGERAAV